MSPKATVPPPSPQEKPVSVIIELQAIRTCVEALEGIDSDARARVLEYLKSRYYSFHLKGWV